MPRIVSWNINLKLRAKWDAVLDLKPDIAILPEVSHADIETIVVDPNRRDWIGDNERKGLGLVTFGEYTLERDASYDPKYQFFLPARISGPVSFHLLAVWAMNHRNRSELAGQRDTSLQAVRHYAPFLATSERTIVSGDFNHNVIWDRPRKTEGNFARIIAALTDLGLASAYHHLRDEDPGKETSPTLHWQHNLAKPYHVDYCFVTKSWLTGAQLALREPDNGPRLSDHQALVADLA